MKVLSTFEGLNEEDLIQKVIESYVVSKEKELFDSLTIEQKEDLGLLLLMKQADRSNTVGEKEIFELLN